MLNNIIELNLDYKKLGVEHNDYKPTLTTYILDNYPQVQGERKRPLVLICPGGGYEHHSLREGEAIAVKMNSFGFDSCILKYSLVPNTFPCALYEAAYAVNYIRNNAKLWGVDENRIIIAGFSAGGHVAGSLGTMWNEEFMVKFAKEYLECDSKYIKPNGMLLGYSVLSSGKYAHRPSFERLLGSKYNEFADYVSLENRVSKDTPKTFLWHTYEDGSVPMENTLLMAQELKKHDVNFEMHIFPKGSHGIGLGTKETDMKDGSKYQPECACWVDMFKTWVENNIQ